MLSGIRTDERNSGETAKAQKQWGKAVKDKEIALQRSGGSGELREPRALLSKILVCSRLYKKTTAIGKPTCYS